MMPPHCTSTGPGTTGTPAPCVLEMSHPGAHMDRTGRTWEDPGVALARLAAGWGLTHRFSYTGRTWIARHRAPGSHWAVESAPTPDLLEEALRAHHGDPPGPAHTPMTKETDRAHIRR